MTMGIVYMNNGKIYPPALRLAGEHNRAARAEHYRCQNK
jgi:hypothetical protein